MHGNSPTGSQDARNTALVEFEVPTQNRQGNERGIRPAIVCEFIHSFAPISLPPGFLPVFNFGCGSAALCSFAANSSAVQSGGGATTGVADRWVRRWEAANRNARTRRSAAPDNLGHLRNSPESARREENSERGCPTRSASPETIPRQVRKAFVLSARCG
jgi:hypothetical protein